MSKFKFSAALRRVLGGVDLLAGRLVVRQFHHVVKAAVVAADVENVHLAVVQAGNGFEPPDAFKLALERPAAPEGVPINNFNRAKGARGAARQPNVAVTAVADPAEQLVIRNGGWTARGSG